MSTRPQAKGKVKLRHQLAIERFRRWQLQHKLATHGEIFQAFDRFVDSAEAEEWVEKEKLEHVS